MEWRLHSSLDAKGLEVFSEEGYIGPLTTSKGPVCSMGDS